MPRTKAAEKAPKTASERRKKVPSLASLQKNEEKDNFVRERLRSSAIGPPPRSSDEIGEGVAPANLRELFLAESTLVEDVALRGKLNQAKEPIAEKMAIYLRVRPFLPQEIIRGENQNCFALFPARRGIAFNPPVTSRLHRRLACQQNGKVGYEFSTVLGCELTQAEVFDLTMRKPMQDFLGGDSQLIFTYGVTNSGKTFTLLGPRVSPGILPRSLNRVFAALGENVSQKVLVQPAGYDDVVALDPNGVREAAARREHFLSTHSPKYPKAVDEAVPKPTSSLSSDASSIDDHGFFHFRPASQAEEDVQQDRHAVDQHAIYYAWVSFLEIYDDVLHDLLDTSGSRNRVLRSGALRLCDESDACYAKGLTQVPVFNAAEAYHILGLGRKNLHVAATKLNESSSRSHAIFTLRVVKVKNNEAEVTQLTFCDLAGTERAGRTENFGTRLKESQNINRDLHHLKECIETLQKTTAVTSTTGRSRRKDMVPYRNCKLTRLFRSFFSGKGRASMIVNISQCASDFDETVQAIRFGSSAMRIMVPMTRRESIMLQPPEYAGKVANRVVSVQVADVIEYPEESEEDSDQENSPPAGSTPVTAVKQKKPRSESAQKTIMRNPHKKPEPAVFSSCNKTFSRENAPKARATSSPVRTVRKRVTKANKTVIMSDASDEDGISSGSSMADGEQNLADVNSTSESNTEDSYNDDEESEEEGEVGEMDLTLGSAVKGAHEIPDAFWEEACPFEYLIGEKDVRIRGLLLMLGDLQTQLKQVKGQSVAAEMRVRKELCDFHDQDRNRLVQLHEKAIRKLEREYAEDLNRQLAVQAEQLERQHTLRGDPSLLRYEKSEAEVECEYVSEELKRLQKENKKLKKQLVDAGVTVDNDDAA